MCCLPTDRSLAIAFNIYIEPVSAWIEPLTGRGSGEIERECLTLACACMCGTGKVSSRYLGSDSGLFEVVRLFLLRSHLPHKIVRGEPSVPFSFLSSNGGGLNVCARALLHESVRTQF